MHYQFFRTVFAKKRPSLEGRFLWTLAKNIGSLIILPAYTNEW